MSTQYRPLVVGLVSPGLFWLATSVAPGQDSPGSPGRPSNSAPASSATYSVLLMSNGRVVRGEIADDPAGGVYRLKTNGGQVPYPRASVKRAGQSIEELYRFQVDSLPVGDVDERIKLVRWCLTEHLPQQAREQLAEVLSLCPDDAQARQMAANLDANAESQGRDAAVRRTAAEVPASDAPAPLPPGIAKMIPKHFGNALPEIFDLPPALAVRRAAEFAEYVQPVLQNNCTSCHGEKYDGEFQLVAVRSTKDRKNPDIARANLDAVLRLVNPDDPARSDLLSAGLVPHGPRKGPIFRGANDRQYQVMAAWVKSLRPKATGAAARPGSGGEGVSRAEYVPPEAGDGFASDRSGRDRSAVSSGVAADRPAAFTPPGATRRVNEMSAAADFSNGAARDFPETIFADPKKAGASASAAATGRKPARPAPKPALPGAKPPGGKPQPGVGPATTESGPAVVATEAQQVAPGVVAVDVNGRLDELPGMNQPKYPTIGKPKEPAAADDDEDAEAPKPGAAKPAAAPKKKVKLDPALLEQMIKARNAGNP